MSKLTAPPATTQDEAVLDSDDLELLLSFFHRRSYRPKTTIIRPGDPANTLYYIIEGSVTVSLEDEEGRELILAYVNAGQYLGEIGLFNRTERRNVLVHTRTNCEIAEIGYERLTQLFETQLAEMYPKLLFVLGKQLSDRLMHTSRKVSRLAFMDVTGRVARTLLDLCTEPDAMSHPDGTQVRISRQEIARIVGCSREMVGRVLKTLEHDGLMSVHGKTIVVFDMTD